MSSRGRSFASVRAQYYETVRPMPPGLRGAVRASANVIIPEGGENRIAIEVIVGRVRDYLREQGIAGR